MRWALITHPDQVSEAARGPWLFADPLVIAEHCIPAAIEQGWIVLARDTGMYDDRTLLRARQFDRLPIQSNPRRRVDP